MEDLEHLRQQNAALAAQVEALRSDIEYVKGKLYILKAGVYVKRDTEKAYARCESALVATPQQHLAELKAEAVLAFANKFNDRGYVQEPLWRIEKYADRIRKGEVK